MLISGDVTRTKTKFPCHFALSLSHTPAARDAQCMYKASVFASAEFIETILTHTLTCTHYVASKP